MKLPVAPLGGISVSLQQAAGYQSGIATNVAKVEDAADHYRH